MRGACAAVAVCFLAAAGLPLPVFGDTIYLKTGEVRQTAVERFSDGAFWVKDGKRTIILDPAEILKIVFTRDPDTSLSRISAARAPTLSRSSAARMLSIPSADASGEEGGGEAGDTIPATEPDLVILNYNAIMRGGIFHVVGEVENRKAVEARYVKVTVFLIDRREEVVDQNFSYVHPTPPHLKPNQKKSFKASFFNPPADVAKYKIRVESGQF